MSSLSNICTDDKEDKKVNVAFPSGVEQEKQRTDVDLSKICRL